MSEVYVVMSEFNGNLTVDTFSTRDNARRFIWGVLEEVFDETLVQHPREVVTLTGLKAKAEAMLKQEIVDDTLMVETNHKIVVYWSVVDEWVTKQ
jgi:hypothetical protein